jgi:hypothetical protein
MGIKKKKPEIRVNNLVYIETFISFSQQFGLVPNN